MAQFTVKVGDTVQAGQVVAILDTSSLQAQLSSLQAKLNEAQTSSYSTTTTTPAAVSSGQLAQAQSMLSAGIITQKEYDKFLATDDYHRTKLFAKIFSEADLRPRPETSKGLGIKILAALSAGAVVVSEVVHNLRCHHGPECYEEHYHGPRPYFKPGVDTPRDVAIRNFEAQMNREIGDMRMGR